jgi:hypothetical protein
MTIKHASLVALQAGEQVTVAPGDTLRVIVTFDYTVSVDASVILRAAPYAYTLGILNRVDKCVTEETVQLPRALDPTSKEATVDIFVLPAADGGPKDGTYGLIAEIPGYDASQNIDDAIVIAGNPEGITELIAPMMMLMMMGMMMGMVKDIK